MRTTFVVLSVLYVLSPSALVDEWPQFRGPTSDGHAHVKTAPTSWSDTENIRWKVAIHDKGWSSPVIQGNQIWMTTALENGKELFAVCVDRQTGKIVHDIKVFSVENPQFCIPFNSYASPTPVLEPGRVYVHFGSPGTACLDAATGRTIWERRDLPCNHFRGPGSSPIIVGDLLVMSFDGFDLQYLVALDKHTGKTVWKKDRDIPYNTDNGDFKKAYSTPSVLLQNGKAPELISPSAVATIAYDPATGNEIWRMVHGGMNASAKPVLGNGLIYLVTGNTKRLLALRQGMSGDLSKSGVVWETNKGVPTRSSLLVVDDLLFMVSDDGIASCLDAKTGKRHWQERLSKAFTASPVYAAGHVYFMDEEGKSFVVEAKPAYTLVATNKLEAGCMASPAILEDGLFIRTKTHLYRVAGR